MCGLVGVIGTARAVPVLMETLSALEYRGYDSAGVATLDGGVLDRRRASGKLENLVAALGVSPLSGTTGIGHTRWATHGAPTESNAHPHATARVALVHNGIIENHAELRAEMQEGGQVFTSETDTEVVVQLVDLHLQRGLPPLLAARAAIARLRGAFALAMIFKDHQDLLFGARNGAPLVLGFGEDSYYLCSDSVALAALTRRVSFLHDGDQAVLTRHGAQVLDSRGMVAGRAIGLTALHGVSVGKQGYRHHMLKEMHEQPAVLEAVCTRLLDPAAGTARIPGLGIDFEATPRMTISGCGSAYYAGLVGRAWLEDLARLPVDAEVASELRYRAVPPEPGAAGLMISQSGETADTLAALRGLQAEGRAILSIVNAPESSIARISDAVLETCAGPEIGVASTKAFTAQLATLACLAIHAAHTRFALTPARQRALVASLLELPSLVQDALQLEPEVAAVAELLAEARDVLFLGRGSLVPIAMEGALKLKELSYIHAEGFAAGEMKHGPIALIDRHVPIVGLAPSGPLFEKTASNLQEAAARGGRIIVISDAEGVQQLRPIAAASITLPAIDPFASPILYTIPMQMIAYAVAVRRGTDVDQPRNLAKSVTVE